MYTAKNGLNLNLNNHENIKTYFYESNSSTEPQRNAISLFFSNSDNLLDIIRINDPKICNSLYGHGSLRIEKKYKMLSNCNTLLIQVLQDYFNGIISQSCAMIVIPLLTQQISYKNNFNLTPIGIIYDMLREDTIPENLTSLYSEQFRHYYTISPSELLKYKTLLLEMKINPKLNNIITNKNYVVSYIGITYFAMTQIHNYELTPTAFRIFYQIKNISGYINTAKYVEYLLKHLNNDVVAYYLQTVFIERQLKRLDIKTYIDLICDRKLFDNTHAIMYLICYNLKYDVVCKFLENGLDPNIISKKEIAQVSHQYNRYKKDCFLPRLTGSAYHSGFECYHPICVNFSLIEMAIICEANNEIIAKLIEYGAIIKDDFNEFSKYKKIYC